MLLFCVLLRLGLLSLVIANFLIVFIKLATVAFTCIVYTTNVCTPLYMYMYVC